MTALDERNPGVVTVYYLCVIGIPMLSQNPILTLTGLLGALAYAMLREGVRMLRSIGFYALMIAVMTLINPLFSHNGQTVLFVLNGAPITLEATVYGAASGCAIVAVLCLFHSFSEVMTRDKLLYVMGRCSPRLALVLSMGLRYVSLLRDRARRIRETQRALGLYREENLPDRIRGDLRVFSILLTWALESGVTTADSMAARGYGIGRRTHYSLFRMRRGDYLLLLGTLLCTLLTGVGLAMGVVDFSCYPRILLSAPTPMAVAAYLAYGVLAWIPILMETEERIRWRCLRSRI